MNPKDLWLLRQVFGRFLIHLTFYPVLLIVALWVLLGHVWPAGIDGTFHPFQNAGGQHDREFGPQLVSDQFAYYALIPCWITIGVLTGVLFRAKPSSPLMRRCCLTLFSLWIVGLCLADPWLPLIHSWFQWAPATAALLCAMAVCYWPVSEQKLVTVHKIKQRKAFLGGVVALLVIGAVAALCMVAFREAFRVSAESSQDSRNKLAIEGALGFSYTGLDETMWILQVEPGGPFDKAGLRREDVIPMISFRFTASLLGSRGRTLVLPAERNGKPFRFAVKVPRFTIPHPARLRSRGSAPRP